MTGLVLLLLLALPAIYALLAWREKGRATRGEIPRSGVRLFIGAFAALTMLFSGGCALLFAGDALMRPGGFVGPELILGVSLPPFLLALVLWLVVMRRPAPPPPPKPPGD